MIQELKKYPDDSINVNSGPVADFKSKTIQNIIQDLKDTAKEHNLEALSAIEIGYPYQIFIIKENGEYKVYANARIIKQSEPFISTESCSYFHNIPISVQRYKNLSLVYQDENGVDKIEKIDDEKKAILLQRMIDFTFNTSLLDRLKPAQRAQAMKALAGKAQMPSFLEQTCPTESKKDYFISLADKLLFFMFISLFVPLFNVSQKTLEVWYSYDKIASYAVVALLIGFFFYAQYEAKKYRQCTSCQIGNQIGFIIKRGTALIALAIAAYFIYH